MWLDPLFWQGAKVTLTYALMSSRAVCQRARLGIAGATWRSFQGRYALAVLRAADGEPRRRRDGLAILLLDKVGLGARALGACRHRCAFVPRRPELGAAYSVVLVSVWFLMGFYMLIFLGGLQDIPRDYYEAAMLDGASAWKAFWFITLPLLRPDQLFRAARFHGDGGGRRPGI